MEKRSLSAPSIGAWTKYTFYGWFLGVALVLALSSTLDAMGIEGMQFYLGLGMGGGIGSLQWLLLKKHGGIALKWVGYLVLGLTLPFLVVDVFLTSIVPYKLGICVAFGALLSGGLQIFALREVSPKANMWLVYAFLGWILALGCLLAIDYTTFLSFYLNNLVLALINLFLILAAGVLLGAVTGIGINKILDT